MTNPIAVGALAKCKFLFESQHETELGLAANEQVIILELPREGWTYCSRASDPSQKGCAPSDYLECIASDATAVSGTSARGAGVTTSSTTTLTATNTGSGVTVSRGSPLPQDKILAATRVQQHHQLDATPKAPAGAVNTPRTPNASSVAMATGSRDRNNAPNVNANTSGASTSALSAMRAPPSAAPYQSRGNDLVGAGGSIPTPDMSALMEGFHKNELYFQQLLAQRQEATLSLDTALREAAQEIDLAKEKHSSMTRRLKELDHMVTKERKRWKDRVEEERLLLAQRSGAVAAPFGGADQQQQQQAQQQQQQQQSRPISYGGPSYR